MGKEVRSQNIKKWKGGLMWTEKERNKHLWLWDSNYFKGWFEKSGIFEGKVKKTKSINKEQEEEIELLK